MQGHGTSGPATLIIDQWCKAKSEFPPTFGKRTRPKGKAAADTSYKSPQTESADDNSPFQEVEEQLEEL